MVDDEETLNRRRDGVDYINYGEPDQMEIEGYKYSKVKTTATVFCYVLTLGLLRLVYHWYPRWMLYSTHSRCDLERAEKVLFVDDYKGKYRSYFVEDVKTLTLSDLGRLEDDDDADFTREFDEYVAGRRTSKLLTVHTEDGFQVSEALRTVECKKLRYAWNARKRTFVRLKGLEADVTKNQLRECKGYGRHEQVIRRLTYGRNEIDVPVAGAAKLLALEVLTPFYVFQLFSIVVWLAEVYYYYCVAIAVMSVFGIASSVMQTRRNQKNLRGAVHSADTARVRRDDGAFEDVPAAHLVPGDVVEIPRRGCVMRCDAVLLNGGCVVDEGMLTGESVPVTKTPLPAAEETYDVKEDANHTLFCGTKVIQTRCYGGDRVLAVVIRTGYLTAKGQLVRSIMYPPPADFEFDRDSYKFVGVLALVAVAGFVYTVVTKSARGIAPLDVLIKALDVVTIALPPALPAAMTVGKLYGLVRLKNRGIFCMNSRVINVAGSVDCVCFDKTGTLTEDGLDMWGVVPVEEGTTREAIRDVGALEEGCPLMTGMAACHSLTLVDGEPVGDPLDVKMFESTGWTLEEPAIVDDLTAPTVVRPKLRAPGIGIVHRYQFSSALQRMSVVTRTTTSPYLRLYCKGSPETVVALSRPETVPADLLGRLRTYTEKGYRVIAMATRSLETLDFRDLENAPRERTERDLTFVGLVVLENRLKPRTASVIRELRRADVRVVMITGDNVQTALSVARECGIVDATETVVDVEVAKPVGEEETCGFAFRVASRAEAGGKDPEKGDGPNRFAMTGNTWAAIRERYPEMVPRVVAKGAVFARMSGEQKQQLVEELQAAGYYVAMCGDGANDCGALKAAHVGISLSEAESSVASPFTATENDISCVPLILREGRAALVTSFGLFKFMLCYSLTELTSVMILYGIDSNLTSIEFLFVDIFLVLNFASVIGKTEAYTGPLCETPPTTSLLGFLPLASIVLQMTIVVAFQIGVYRLIRTYDWFEPFVFDPRDTLSYDSYENYAVFCLSLFQYVILAVVFSKGRPYRKSVCSNGPFTFSLVVTTLACAYVVVCPSRWTTNLFELKLPPRFDGRTAILLLAAANFACSFLAEEVIVEMLLERVSRRTRGGRERTRRRRPRTAGSVADCDINAVIVNETKNYATRL